ncbi:MAG: SUMF1/EgtB/PvdO family nonheme iron enzyme [Planctomycetales bacterium]
MKSLQTIRCSLPVGLLIVVVAVMASHAEEPKPSSKLPPLTEQQVLEMVTSGMNSVDILVEARHRGLNFVVSEDVIQQLQKKGGDALLLNWLGLYSVELQEPYKRCLRQRDEKQPGRVVETATDLLKRSPRLLNLYLIRGAALRAQGKLKEAEQDFRQALKYHPNGSRARVLLGETLIAEGETKMAIAELQKVVEHRSPSGIQDWPVAHWLLGRAYLQRKDYRQASRELHTALWQMPYHNTSVEGLFPDLEDHFSMLVRLLALCPDPTVASPADAIELATLMKIMAANEAEQQTALLRLAEAQAAAGQFDDAIASQKAAELISAKSIPEGLRDRVALYQKKTVPYLPTADGGQVAQPAPQKATSSVVETLLARMKVVGDKAEGSKGTKPFWIGKYELTRGEWAAIMDLPVPWFPDMPVERVSWDDCQALLKKLNEKAGPTRPQFRLPTVAEWKLASLAGGAGGYFFGEEPAALASYGWYRDNAERRLHRGGMLRENAWGLFDVCGNLAEWCQDEATPDGRVKTDGKGASFRSVSGGSYLGSAELCSAANIGFARQDEARRGLGVRLVADVVPEGTTPKTAPPPPVAETKPPASPPKVKAGLTLAIDYARNTLETEVFQRSWLQDRLFALLYLQACVRSRSNDLESAAANLRALIREMPDDNAPLMTLARCHLAWIQANREGASSEQIEDAKKIVEAALSRNEFKSWISYLTQSAVLVAEKNYDDASRRAMQARDLAPARFKDLCIAQLKSIDEKKASATRDFPLSPAVPPSKVGE